ncbi:MAG: hypothetical protein J6B89_02830 [Bacilli bacterium]|nr:hypothetical protein [Bacilli bacterium]
MDINIDSLKIEVNKLNKLLQEYEQNYLNLYNELSSTSFFWKDKNAIDFSTNLNKEKFDVHLTLDELKKIRDVYNYVISKYQDLGSKIKFNLTVRDDVYSRFNSYLGRLDEIINCYKAMDLSFCTLNESSLVSSELKKLSDVKNRVLQLKDKIKSIFDNIELIENEVNLRLSKIKLGIIKEDEIIEYI